MVSFQCHACGDVVKKPKLDQHRGHCGSGFDCIDCQTTFNSPAEYKGHTQCISEAEKYQKGLYKGPKANGGQQNNRSHPPQGKYQSWNGGGGPRNGWQKSRYEATGANGTPLGTPVRMSPRLPLVDDENQRSSNNIDHNTDQPKPNDATASVKENKSEKRKSISDEDSKSGAQMPSSGDGEKKKKKKQKLDEDSPSIPLPPSPLEAVETACSQKDGEKLHAKKEKSKKRDGSKKGDDTAPSGKAVKERDIEKPKKKKKKSKAEIEDTLPAENIPKNPDASHGADGPSAVEPEKKKEKKKRKHREEENDEPEKASGTMEKGKSKKHKKDGVSNEGAEAVVQDKRENATSSNADISTVKEDTAVINSSNQEVSKKKKLKEKKSSTKHRGSKTGITR